MKGMKKIVGCLVGVLLAAEAWTSGTLTLGSHVFTQGDSLHIELLLNLSDTKGGDLAEAYLFTSRAAWRSSTSARTAGSGGERTSPCPVPTTAQRFNCLPAICLLTVRFMSRNWKAALFIRYSRCL